MDTLITRIVEETAMEANPYFTALAGGEFGREDFVETQVQFHIAVVFFSRPMAAVAAKIPDRRLRVEVLRNVWEEHGEGHGAQQHGSTFLELLNRLAGLTPADVDRRVLWPEVRMFNTTLTGACVMDEYLVGVGVLGMIERLFVDVSTWIGAGIVERGWLASEDLVHYHVHRSLDVKHAADFFDVLRPRWEASEADRYYIEQGLRQGALAFNTLYEGLYRARGRRWMRAIVQPHSRT